MAERKERVKQLVAALIARVMPSVQPGSENHAIATRFVLENFAQHRFLDATKEQMQRDVAALVDKLRVRDSDEVKAGLLERSFARFQALNPSPRGSAQVTST